MKNLLIVESPAKAKTIGKYLGKDYEVLASFGHIRDLPSKDGSVEPNNDFAMHYQVAAKSSKHVKDIVDKAKNCQKLILAPDPDREGESIAWHILEVLKQKKAIKSSIKVERVVFNAITKNSVTEAIKNPREIDMDLVNAQQARRIMDRLIGFELSPILWSKVQRGLSAGRVQSVAVRLIVEREKEIEAFVPQGSYKITAIFNLPGGKSLKAELPKNFETEKEAYSFLESCVPAEFSIKSLETKPAKKITCTSIYDFYASTRGLT